MKLKKHNIYFMERIAKGFDDNNVGIIVLDCWWVRGYKQINNNN